MRKKLIAGAALLALLMNSPQVSAEDEEVVIFGGEFDDEQPAPRPVERPAPIRDVPPPVEKPKPVVEKPEPVVEKVEPQPSPEPVHEPQPLPPPVREQNPPPVEQQPVQRSDEEIFEDDDLGDVLIFDDFSRLNLPVEDEQPVVNPQPQPIDEPVNETINEQIDEPVDEPFKIDKPFKDEPVVVVPPPVDEEPPMQRREPEKKTRRDVVPDKDLRELRPRFIKLAADETYTYYLDKTSVQWRKMPYSTSEYIADVWIRMIEHTPSNFGDDMEAYGEDSFNTEISLARQKGFRYGADDLRVLRHPGYVLEHYYLRPKTKQIQFLCELEVFGRPQNTINERNYDYSNWENLVPGSIESAIYNSVIQLIDTTKADPKGHMTFSDMLDEYLRISL